MTSSSFFLLSLTVSRSRPFGRVTIAFNCPLQSISFTNISPTWLNNNRISIYHSLMHSSLHTPSKIIHQKWTYILPKDAHFMMIFIYDNIMVFVSCYDNLMLRCHTVRRWITDGNANSVEFMIYGVCLFSRLHDYVDQSRCLMGSLGALIADPNCKSLLHFKPFSCTWLGCDHTVQTHISSQFYFILLLCEQQTDRFNLCRILNW